MSLLIKFQQSIKEQNLFSAKDKLLLAVSGGVDSVIAIVSGHVNEALLDAAAAAGVSDVLGKQDSMDALADAVRALMEAPPR